MMTAVETIGHILLDYLPPPTQDPKVFEARHTALSDRFTQLQSLLEAEVFEERYMDSYVREEERKERQARQEALIAEERRAAASARVASWSEE